MKGASLDIEASGVDRDSGAGIVMAPGAVDAVDVVAADRNDAPTVETALDDRTFALGANAVTLDLADTFDDPDNNTLTYSALSSNPDRAALSRTGSMLTLTPGAPGTATVTVRATDPDGLSAVDSFSVSVTLGTRDYDRDDDDLIEVSNLAQLDAIRYDSNGNGIVDDPSDWPSYFAAFTQATLRMGCSSVCIGYELTADLDFDTDSSGGANDADTYWNGGEGWEPIGDDPYQALFEGNGHTIANLFIDRDTENDVGLFSEVGEFGLIRNLGLEAVDVTGKDYVGGLVGDGEEGRVGRSHVTGSVSGEDVVGGLAGSLGRVWSSYRRRPGVGNRRRSRRPGGGRGHYRGQLRHRAGHGRRDASRGRRRLQVSWAASAAWWAMSAARWQPATPPVRSRGRRRSAAWQALGRLGSYPVSGTLRPPGCGWVSAPTMRTTTA